MRIGPLLIASAVLFALAGCVQSDTGSPTAAPSPSVTPVFASDAEALAAAEKAYAAYLKVSDEIAHDGGKGPARIAEYVSPSRLKIELDGSKLFASKGIRTTGSTAYLNPALQQVVSYARDTEVTFYACWDSSAVRVIGPEGGDITPADRHDRQSLLIVLETIGGKLPLRLTSDDPWPSRRSC